jgi:hypothetical protein
VLLMPPSVDLSLVCPGRCRVNSDVRRLMADPNSALHEFRNNIILVEDPIVNEISSTKIRSEMSLVWPISYIHLAEIWMPQLVRG